MPHITVVETLTSAAKTVEATGLSVESCTNALGVLTEFRLLEVGAEWDRIGIARAATAPDGRVHWQRNCHRVRGITGRLPGVRREWGEWWGGPTSDGSSNG